MTCYVNHPFLWHFKGKIPPSFYQKIIFGKATKKSTQTLNLKEFCLFIWRDMITFLFLFTFSGELCFPVIFIYRKILIILVFKNKFENQNTWLEAFYLIERVDLFKKIYFPYRLIKKKQQICWISIYIKLCVSNQLIVGLWYANLN